MVRLDVRGAGTTAGLDDVGVEGALDEELHLAGVVTRRGLRTRLEHEGLGRRLEGADELAPDDLALLLGVADAGEGVEELLLGVDGDEADTGRGDVVLLHLLALVGAEEPVVDEHARQLVADGLVHEGGGHGGVDPTGETGDDPGVAHLRPDAGDLLVDDVRRVPVTGQAGGTVQEVLEHG